MRFILDADGLIKLNHAGVLERVAETYSCVIPEAVYDEVVTQGKARRYMDAEAIEVALTQRVQVTPVQGPLDPELRLGAGERAILGLLPQMPDAIVVSDDRRFLTVLSYEGIHFMTPADMLVLLARHRILGKADSREALNRLRPSIRMKAYWDALQDLESAAGGNHEEY